MLSLMCSGPRGLTLVGEAGSMISGISATFTLEEKDIRTSRDRITDRKTLLFVSNRGRPKKLRFFVTPAAPEEILADAFASGWWNCVSGARNHPRNIIMRLYGDPAPVISQLEKELPSSRDSFHNLLRRSSGRGVALCFTRSPLNRPLSASDIHEEVLLAALSFDDLYQRLEARALDIFNESIGRRDWTEMEIRIYDAYGNYIPHVERLRTVLRSLQIGLNLGEGWGKDHARILMPIMIYRVRLFTFTEPAELKKILMGLEHAREGERFVDMDLFVKRKKYSWTELAGEDAPHRQALGARMRAELFGRLSPPEKEHLQRLEKEVLSERT